MTAPPLPQRPLRRALALAPAPAPALVGRPCRRPRPCRRLCLGKRALLCRARLFVPLQCQVRGCASGNAPSESARVMRTTYPDIGL